MRFSGDVNPQGSSVDTGFQDDGLWGRHKYSVWEISHSSGHPGLAEVGGGGLTSCQT